MTRYLTTLCLCFGLLLGAVAQAEEPVDAAKDANAAPASAKDDKKGDRLFFSIGTGVNFSLTDNRDVVGQTTGTSFLIGLNLDTKLEYYKLGHEIRTNLIIDEQFSYTPDLDRIIKSADKFAIDAIYLYNISADLWGPFAKAHFETQLFNGFLNTMRPEYYVFPDGTTVAPFDQLQISGSFDPIKISESVGLFVKPWTREWLKTELRAGLGGLHVIADTVYIAGAKDETTGRIPLTQVESFNQLGAAFAAMLSGTYKLDAPITYGASADILVPFVYDDPMGRAAGELTNYNFAANVGVEVAPWLSVGYRLSVVRQPQVSEEWQIQNNLLVSFRYSFEKEVPEEAAPTEAPAPAAEPAPAPVAEPAPAPVAEPAPAPAAEPVSAEGSAGASPAPAPEPAPAAEPVSAEGSAGASPAPAEAPAE